jgi:hypothetical protein
MRIFDLQHRKLAGERRTSLGIDIQSVGFAPGRKFVRINYCSEHGDTIGLPLPLLPLCLLFPFG